MSLGVAVVVAVLVVRQATFVQLHSRIDGSLVQEAGELRALSRGRDPRTGEPFAGDVRRIFEVFLAQNVPGRNEVHLAILNGRLVGQRDDGGLLRTLTRHEALMERLAALRSPGSERGSVETASGTADYLAVPVSAERQNGVFVTAIFSDLEEDLLSDADRNAIAVAVIVLLFGSVIAWRIAETVLQPVRAATATARRISGEDLTERLPLTGHDELSELSATFNAMLDKLEEAFDTQRRFVDDAGHELRTPITVIRGHLDLMGEDPEDRRATLELVDDELDRMQRIVNDLLTLAKAERPDFLLFEPVDVATLIEDSFAKAEALGPREWQLGPTCRGVVIADRQRLTQAIMQLAQNAVQHTQPDDRIEIGCRFDRAAVELWVLDTGEGIEPDEVEHIFDRFTRGRGRGGSEGAGLGLSIVRAIAEAHHGRVEIESVRGGGSRFTIVIPADQPMVEVIGG
ncbi:MAG TPA: ATP-binding protein [Actinomycetota bacterium]|nr:ATP-binding protein [Actinomycetota bacterium]